jgi:hypothetical protein
MNTVYILLLACGPQPEGARLRCRSSMIPHRQRRVALHLPARRSRQNANGNH